MDLRHVIALHVVALSVAACAGDGKTRPPASPTSAASGTEQAQASAPESESAEVELGTCRLPGANHISILGAARPGSEALGSLVGDEVPVGGLGVRGTGQGSQKLPRVVVRQPTTPLGMDKAIIRRVMLRRRQQIKYCYEKQLVVNPNLSGTVTVKFAIDPSGQVGNVSAQGMHGGVATCVANVVRRMRFPTPSGGGVVQVTYPFRFALSAGGSAPVSQPTPPAPASQPTSPAPASQPTPPLPVEPPAESFEPAGALTSLTGQSLLGRGCLDVEPGDSVLAALPAVETCYQHALAEQPSLGGRVFVELRADAAGAVTRRTATGVGSETFQRCVADAFTSAKVPVQPDANEDERAMVCSIALRNPKHALGTEDAEWVTVETSKLRLGDSVLGNRIEWSTDPAGNAWRALNLLLQALPPDDEDRTMVVRGQPTVDAAAFITTVSFIERETSRHHFVYGRAASDQGRLLLNPLGTPGWSRHCGDVPTPEPLAVLLEPGGIWVGTAEGRELVAPVDGEPHLIGYSRALRGLKRARYQYRSDLEIAALPGVPFRYLAKMIEIAVDTGFFDVRLVDVGDLSADPRKLPPRAQP